MAKPQRNVKRFATPNPRTDYSLPRQQLRLRRYVTLVVVVAAASLLFYSLFFSHFFKINRIIVRDNKPASVSDITSQTNQLLNSSLLGRNILFMNSGALAKNLAAKNYQFVSVVARKHYLHTVEIVVVERASSLLWQSGNTIYVLSQDGRAIEQANGQKPNSQLSVIHDDANLPVKLGDTVVPTRFIDFVRQVLQLLPKQGLKAQSLSVPVTTNELYVQTSGGYIIKFDTNRVVEEQLSDLAATLATLKSQKKQPQEYIDLRVAGKVFYH